MLGVQIFTILKICHKHGLVMAIIRNLIKFEHFFHFSKFEKWKFEKWKFDFWIEASNF